MMSNQVEVNNNTIDVDGGLRLAEEKGNLSKNECGASWEIEQSGSKEQDRVRDAETSCLKTSGKVEETRVEVETEVVLAEVRGGADVEKAIMVEEAKEASLFLETEMQKAASMASALVLFFPPAADMQKA